MIEKIWKKGPLELLNHGRAHIQQGNSFDLRIAMISIDNAIEVAIKTFIALNKRKLNFPANFKTSMISFKELLNALQKFVPNKVSNNDLDAIEQLHKWRNQLYHEGNGITIEPEIVKEYAKFAEKVISELFNSENTIEKQPKKIKNLNNFIQTSATFLENSEKFFEDDFFEWSMELGGYQYLRDKGLGNEFEGVWDSEIIFEYLIKEDLLTEDEKEKYNFIYEIREKFNEDSLPNPKDLEKAIEYLKYFYNILSWNGSR